MNYSYTGITLYDIPDEISLGITLNGCPLRCEGCHSAETRDPTFGVPLTTTVLEDLIKNNGYISCVLFYGGDWNPEVLIKYLEVVRNIGLKVALYSGFCLKKFNRSGLLPYLDYIKVGPYREKLGGLCSSKTNQRLYKIDNDSLLDITDRFWKG